MCVYFCVFEIVVFIAVDSQLKFICFLLCCNVHFGNINASFPNITTSQYINMLQALLGSVAAAAYNLTFQLGFATTQICESVAVAVQTLLAREIAGADKNNAVTTTTTTPHGRREANRRAKRIRHLINGSILAGGLVAGSLSLVTFLQKESVLRSLTTDIGIREASRVIFPAVLVTQGEWQF